MTRSCAPPVFFGSRRMTTWLAPVSARKISPFGATVSKRGRLKSAAKMLMWKPDGTVGRKPCGACDLLGPLPADLVANGGGRLGFCPGVTCAGPESGTNRKAKTAASHFAYLCGSIIPRSLGMVEYNAIAKLGW